MSEKDVLLQMKDIVKVFGKNVIINHISLDIERGKFITFLGPSGCGKTTLLRMIAGFYHLDGGSIILNGRSIERLPPQKRNTPMVFQEYALFPHMTVEENVSYGLKNQKIPKEEISRKVKEVLELVNLTGLEKRYPNQMSGGQQQRVAIARALVNSADLLLLDEPSMGLAPILVKEIFNIIKDINEKGTTVLLVEQNAKMALSIADRAYVMETGNIVMTGTGAELVNSPEIQKAYLGG